MLNIIFVEYNIYRIQYLSSMVFTAECTLHVSITQHTLDN